VNFCQDITEYRGGELVQLELATLEMVC